MSMIISDCVLFKLVSTVKVYSEDKKSYLIIFRVISKQLKDLGIV